MAFFIRNNSSPSTMHRTPEGQLTFIHAAPTVMHDSCFHDAVPGATAGTPTERLDARDEWAAPFGVGWDHCWAPLWTTDPERAPDCYFCGKPVLGRG